MSEAPFQGESAGSGSARAPALDVDVYRIGDLYRIDFRRFGQVRGEPPLEELQAAQVQDQNGNDASEVRKLAQPHRTPLTFSDARGSL